MQQSCWFLNKKEKKTDYNFHIKNNRFIEFAIETIKVTEGSYFDS